MDSITKPQISEDQLKRISRKHLGETPVSTCELKDGWFNAAFLITLAEAKFVLKVAPPDDVKVLRYEKDLMEAEVSSMREIKEKTNVPVPGIVAYDISRDEVAGDYFLAECVPGEPLDRVRDGFTSEDRSKVDQQIGSHLKSLHAVQGNGFGAYNEPIYATWTDAFSTLLDNLAKDRQDQNVELPEGAFEAAVPHMGALSEVTTPFLVHWDLWDGNIFVDPASKQVTGFIDFERALWGDPLIEANFQTPSPSLLAGYEHPILSPPGARARRALYDLYLSLIMVIECTYRHFQPDHETPCREFLARSIATLRALP